MQEARKIVLKPLIVVAGLTLAPFAALAQGCQHDRQTAASCAEGMHWDSDAAKCVPTVSS